MQSAESPRSSRETAADPDYSEKLWPAWWLWTVAALMGASLSLIFFPISATLGFLTMGAGIALLVSALVATTPRIQIRRDALAAGRAHIGTEHIGRVVAHRGAAAREQLGPGFDARSYQCIRGWIDAVVTVEITDPEDATPYWVFSTRHPQAVLRALGSQEPVREQGVSVTE